MLEFLLPGFDWEALLNILVALHGVALAVVNLTPTPKDNEVVASWYRAIELLAGVINKKAKS